MRTLEGPGRGERIELRREIAHNCRMMRLAEHCGFKIVTRDVDQLEVSRIWYVPEELQPIVGCMAAVVG